MSYILGGVMVRERLKYCRKIPKEQEVLLFVRFLINLNGVANNTLVMALINVFTTYTSTVALLTSK